MSLSLPVNPTVVRVAETFASIQGEGKLAGVPSFFVRLSGCNLRCTWCDTPYASWKPEGESIPVDRIVELARASGVRHAVVTGGEPMMFPQSIELSARLAAAGFHITFETAGTVLPNPASPGGGVTCHLMSISPKLSNSTPRGAATDARDPSGPWEVRHEQRRLNIPVLQHLLDQFPSPARQIKFVVAREVARDLAEIDLLLTQLHGWTTDDVLLMPEGVQTPTREHTRELVRVCLERGWRYCPRLHIELFGNVRGT